MDGAARGKKRKRAAPGLADLHDDMLERVLAHLPPASYFRVRSVSRRWRAAVESRTFRAACASVTARDPWFLMPEDPDHQDQDERRPRPAAAVFDSAERTWARWRGAPRPLQPLAAAGGLVLYRDPGTGDLTVVNPLTGASRALPPPSTSTRALQAVTMYGSPTYLRRADLQRRAARTSGTGERGRTSGVGRRGRHGRRNCRFLPASIRG